MGVPNPVVSGCGLSCRELLSAAENS